MFEIKEASKKDCPLIHHLASQVWEPTYGNILSREQLEYMFDWMYSVPSLETQMDSGHTYYILFEDENPVGYLSIEKEKENLFHLQKIYIIPSVQGKGLGKLLIEKAEEHIKKYNGNPEAFLELNVNRHNGAVNFYKRMGFEIDREVDNDIGNNFFMNDYIMKKKVTCK
ncbi:MAG: GNAT family N-acetyltransferase [Candidatus Azobacteroides sp.]|nr:GNAT family N-acetyltransferase [Candidatus Azobacteroides sp.]